MKKTLSDFHIHSTFSDGSLSPEQIIKEAKRLGIKHISITDHDSVGAYVDKQGNPTGILEKARKKGIELIPGVELTVKCDGIMMDLLAYGFDPLNPEMQRLTGKSRRLDAAFSLAVCRMLERKGFRIGTGKLLKEGSVSPAKILRELASHPENPKLLDRFGFKDGRFFFSKILDPKSEFFVKPAFLPVEEALKGLKCTRAVTSLAHPLLYFKGGLAEKKKKILKIAASLKELGLDGIETRYGGCSRREAFVVCSVAKKLGLLRTRGSDFHNSWSHPDKKFRLGHTPSRSKDFFARKLKKRINSRKR